MKSLGTRIDRAIDVFMWGAGLILVGYVGYLISGGG